MLDVLVIGAGPHALTLATLLSCPDQACTCPNNGILNSIQLTGARSKNARSSRQSISSTDRIIYAEESEECQPTSAGPALAFTVVDTYGEWAVLWENQFKALNISHLRSHTLVHTDPLDKGALQEYVLQHKREKELHSLPGRIYILDENAFFNDGRLGKRGRRHLCASMDPRRNLCFCLPSSQLSMDFFKEQVHRYGLDRVLLKATVEKICPIMAKNDVDGHHQLSHFRVLLQGGKFLEARRVVMATGPTRAQMANVPSWVANISENYPEERLRHSVWLMHPQQAPKPPAVCQEGERLVVVGGGLSSAHIISVALQQGASHVTWVMRKHLQLKQFDVGDIESLVGRYSHVEHGTQLDGRAYLRQYYRERSFHKRLAMIRQARKGGAVTPEAYMQLQPFIQSGQLSVRAYCQVLEASWCYKKQLWDVSLSCGDCWSGDRIWLATGCKLDVNQDPLLADVVKEFPIQVLDGWPCISQNLQWAPGCPLYLMGQYAALQIGPHAVNMAGGQAASIRIARDIIRQQRDSGEEPKPSEEIMAHKIVVEEYVQQMHGLMWL